VAQPEMVPDLPPADGASADVRRPDLEPDVASGVIEDHEDLQGARKESGPPPARRPFWRRLGPGLITGAADDDPSGIGTYSVAGAQFGLSMLWLVPFCLPLMVAVQEMCGRIAVVSGKGLAAVIKEHYPRWLLHCAVVLLVVANAFNVYADLAAMAASARMVVPLPLSVWLTIATAAIIGLQVLVPYRQYVRILKWLCLALVSYAVVAAMPGVRHDWPAVLRHLVTPSWIRGHDYALAVVGFLGTTISPYLFFWQAGEQVEEVVAEGKADRPGHRKARASEEEMRSLRGDTTTGMLASQLVAFFIMVCAADTLHASGVTHIDTAEDAARALLPLGGRWAFWLFSLGIIGTGALAIPTLAGSAAYAVSETLGWRYGLYRRFSRARGFYGCLIAVVLLGYVFSLLQSLSPVKALFYSAVLNGLVAAPLIVVLLLVCNNRAIVAHRRNGLASNLVGGLAAALMAAASAAIVWSLLTGRAF
jgi:NRAMP (natural resistance-associated macrophage protein)-like metal ion transporter